MAILLCCTIAWIEALSTYILDELSDLLQSVPALQDLVMVSRYLAHVATGPTGLHRIGQDSIVVFIYEWIVSTIGDEMQHWFGELMPMDILDDVAAVGYLRYESAAAEIHLDEVEIQSGQRRS